MKEYQIADRKFFQKELVYGQLRLLRDFLKRIDLNNVSTAQFMDLILADIPALLAIILIPAEQTQQQKVRDGQAGVDQLRDWLAENLSPSQAKVMVPDFFALNPVENLALFNQAGTIGAGLKIPSFS